MVDEHYVPDDSDYVYSACSDGTLVVELWNGTNTSLILTRTFTNLPSEFQTYAITFSNTEIAAVTNWQTITVQLIVNGADRAILNLEPLFRPLDGPVILYVRARGVL